MKRVRATEWQQVEEEEEEEAANCVAGNQETIKPGRLNIQRARFGETRATSTSVE